MVTPWSEFTGQLAAVQTVEVRPRVSGYIARVDFRDGAQVHAGDPLFSIDLFGGDQGITTGNTGTVLRLQPNGAWAHDPSVPALPLPLSQVRFFDAQHGWIVGYGTILYTEDGGKTWRFCQG